MSEADKPKNEKNPKDTVEPTPATKPTPGAAGSGPSATPGAHVSTEPSARATEPAARDKDKGGRGVALLALLVGLAGLGAGGYALLQQQQLRGVDQRIEQGLGEFRGLPGRIQQLGERNDQLASRLQSLEQLPSAQTLEERGRLLAELQGQQQQLSQRVEQVLGSSREQWRLAEAEYLERMAMLRLSAMQDVQSAIALLNEADLILRRQNDPGAYAAREKLLEGLEALRSLPEIDRSGLFMQLGALQVHASRLAALAPEFQVGGETAGTPQQNTWERWLDQLGRYVRIEFDSDAQVKPLLAGQSLAQVRLALSLAIEQAQWAVLNGNAVVYRQSLAQAVSLLQSLFSEDNEQASALVKRLQQLADRQVEVQLPELTPALRALQAYIGEREQNGNQQPARPDAAPEQPAEEPAPADEGASEPSAPAQPAAAPAEEGLRT